MSIHIVVYGFPGGSDGKESACNVEDLDSIVGSGISPGEGNGILSQGQRLLGGYSAWDHKELDMTE